MVTIAASEKKQKNYFSSFLIFIIAVAIVFFAWKTFLAQPKPVPPEIEAKYKAIEINFNTLKSSEIRDLQLYTDIVNFDGAFGRENPFSSY